MKEECEDGDSLSSNLGTTTTTEGIESVMRMMKGVGVVVKKKMMTMVKQQTQKQTKMSTRMKSAFGG